MDRKKITGEHNGTVQIKSGIVSVDNKKLRGDFIIDMNSIVNNDITDKMYNKKLVEHLKSDDFFNVRNFPESF